MKEIALHLLDIVQNSVRAGASHVDIRFLLGSDGVLEIRRPSSARSLFRFTFLV